MYTFVKVTALFKISELTPSASIQVFFFFFLSINCNCDMFGYHSSSAINGTIYTEVLLSTHFKVPKQNI